MDCFGKTKTTDILAIQPAGGMIGTVSSMCGLDQVKIHFSPLAVKSGSGTKAFAMRVGEQVRRMGMAISYSASPSTAIFTPLLVFGCSFNSRATSKRDGMAAQDRLPMSQSCFLNRDSPTLRY